MYELLKLLVSENDVSWSVNRAAIMREQRVLLPVAGLPRVIRSIVPQLKKD